MTAPINSIQSAGPAAVDDSRRASRANLEKAAQKFEAVFVNMMLKEARKTSLGGGMFENDAMRTFRDMQDARFSEEMAKRGTLGIAKAMADFLDRAQPMAATDEAKGAPE
ncbi:hypothetical protein BSL82_07850 [Tardibacter chloracetimidivorans]|uniref:Flagellar protein FlgJ N-terminal domain-containing protein n=1 Tax=Tardibacter chloracetimidivorans TaxID=1921510 RepID=A0A1L3ZUB4_9SPHN|nr:rod-binding protein [Tardibacter chloracetimidivorans]API59232.1 hypothetical protein BSL82_07850 [Tardibacter chloracetimidivorans]